MTMTAQSVIRRCVDTLQDTTGIRWATNELVRYLNDGQRAVVTERPDAMVTNAAKTLVAGTKQSIPTGGAKLMDVVRNTVSKKAVRLTNREILDSQNPNWHAQTGALDVIHYTFDPRDPTTFYVYPPALDTSSVDLVYSAYPADVAEPADGALYTAVTGNISVPDIFGNALQDYILFRAYSKDSEYAGNAARATAHYAAFANTLGIEIKATVAAQPTSAGNPNT